MCHETLHHRRRRAAGATAAARLRRLDEQAEIYLIERTQCQLR